MKRLLKAETLYSMSTLKIISKKTDFREAKEFKAWKSYNWNTLDQLNEEVYIIDRHGNKSLWLTEEGVQKAKEILDNLHISDWEKKE